MKHNRNTAGRKFPAALMLAAVCALFAALTAAYAWVFPVFSGQSVSALDNAAALSVPNAVIAYPDQTDLWLSEEAKQQLSMLGTVLETVYGETESASGIRLQLNALPQAYLSDAVCLISGRMPQNETECIAVSCQTGGETLCEIGKTIYLSASDGDASCPMTVVGIGYNQTAALAPYTMTDRQAILYTTDAAAWINEAYAVRQAAVMCQPSQNDGGVSDAASEEQLGERIARVFSDCREAQISVYRTLSAEAVTAARENVQIAEDALTAAEILLQESKNRLESAELCAEEAEDALLCASDALETERQAFISDMEKHEYYAVNQTSLIPRRDQADERFAKQEAEIEALTAALQSAFEARESAAAAVKREEARFALLQKELQNAANAAEAVVDAAENAESDFGKTPVIALRNAETGHMLLSARAAKERNAGMILSCILLLLFLGCLLASRPKAAAMVTLCVFAGVGAFLGGCVMPAARFHALFSAYSAYLKQYALLSPVYPVTLLCALLVFLGFVLLCLCVRGIAEKCFRKTKDA